MKPPRRPELADADDLTGAADIDIGSALVSFSERRLQSPIVRPSTADAVKAMIDDSFPAGNESLEALVEQLDRVTERYPRRNTHPGFFGWIAPSGLPSDPLALALAGALNENVNSYWASPFGTTLERCVVGWLAALAGLPRAAEGVLLSGGSVANMMGIASALSRRYGADYRRRGLPGSAAGAPPTIICSAAAHFSVRRAAVLLGLGTDSIVSVATDHAFRMSPAALAQALEQHRDPVCVVATAGTTNTGAIDPLDDIAALCRSHRCWLHVDAAYGGGGLMSPELRPRYRGIEQADSLVMDLHKWFYQTLDCSLLLYRDARFTRELFRDEVDYLDNESDDAPEKYRFFQLSPELSRRARALPVYLALRCYGIPRLGRNVLHNVRCAEYLASLIERHPQLELVVAPQLSILCFRYRPGGLDDAEIDRINGAIRDRIQLEGDFLMSPTRVHGRPVLRLCIVNHATRAAHVEALLESVLRIGATLH